MQRPTLISLVVPVFNEVENVEAFCAAADEVMQSLPPEYDYEIVFTDNHSTDGTFGRLRRIARENPRVRAYRFSKNFGFERSVYTGYMLAAGDAAVQLDCDLQDPPALIPEFIRRWRDGYHVVYGVRRRRDEAWWMSALRRAFYRLLNMLSDDELPADAGEFRLVDRQVIEELRKIEDCHPYVRGTIASLGFEQVGVPYDRCQRARGQSKFGARQLLHVAFNGLLNHSLVPLRLATYTGLLISSLTVLAIIGYCVARFATGKDWPAGFATLTILLLFSVGLTSLFLGIIGEYLGRIYQQLKRRPLTIIQEQVPAAVERATSSPRDRQPRNDRSEVAEPEREAA